VKIEKTRKELQKEVSELKNRFQLKEICNDKLIVENEKLRTEILKLNEMTVRNAGLNIALQNNYNEGTKELKIIISESCFRFQNAIDLSSSIAQQVKSEILKAWPKLNMSIDGKFTYD
jgi:hypothetical protein